MRNRTTHHSLDCPNFPSWVIFPEKNDTLVFINDIVITALNAPLSLWAFVSNLALIVAVFKSPSLHIRCNVLLCSLAAADCLTGLVVQPSFACWRLALHYLHCGQLEGYFLTQEVTYFALNGCSFIILSPISCDRLYALYRPMVYRAVVKEMRGEKGLVQKMAVTMTATIVMTRRATVPESEKDRNEDSDRSNNNK